MCKLRRKQLSKGFMFVKVIRRSFIIPTLSSKSYFVDNIVHFRSRRKENSSEISAHGIYRSVIFFSPINQIAINKHNDEELELLCDKA